MPKFKLTIASTVYENTEAISIKNMRPENNISTLEFVINDYKNRNYSDVVTKFAQVTLQLANKSQSYTTVFIGEVVALQPSNAPEILTVYCEGYERALKETHCESSFGVESLNPTKDTTREIIQDLVDEYVEKTFEGAATNWTIASTDTYVDNVHAGLSVTNLTSKYLDNFTVLNRLLDIVNAYAITLVAPEPGIHWIAKPNAADPRLYVKEIGDNHSNADWDKYYGGTQALATITQGTDLIDYQFHQTGNEFANNVILACNLRKPSYDYWTEDAATNSIWTVDGDGATSDDAANKVVGADSLKLTNNASRWVKYYFNFANNLDLTNIGSQDTIPTINFYARRTSNSACLVWLNLYTTRGTDWFQTVLYRNDSAGYLTLMPNALKWYGISIPIGPFYKNWGGAVDQTWNDTNGTPLWTDIDGVELSFSNVGYAGENYFWIDDLHISGKIIREARDAGAITGGEKERQAFLRLDTAVDDTCNTTTNTGTAALLAASELFKRSEFKTTAANRGLTGSITLPMKEDLLPGQQLHIHAGTKLDGTYRYNLDMRIQNLTHMVSNQGYLTRCNLTSDLWNSHTLSTPSAWGILQENAGALRNAEARDLKASGVDIGIPRLTWDPTA